MESMESEVLWVLLSCLFGILILLNFRLRDKVRKEISNHVQLRLKHDNEIEFLQEEIEKLKVEPKKTLTIDAQQVLHDLTRGGAVVKITPLDPTEIFYRAPTR